MDHRFMYVGSRKMQENQRIPVLLGIGARATPEGLVLLFEHPALSRSQVRLRRAQSALERAIALRDRSGPGDHGSRPPRTQVQIWVKPDLFEGLLSTVRDLGFVSRPVPGFAPRSPTGRELPSRLW